VIASLTFIGQMFYVQIGPDSARIREGTLKYGNNWVTVYPARGSIYDRWGSLLAGNEQVYEVDVDLNLVSQGGNPITIATVANDVLGIDYKQALDLASTPFQENQQSLVLKKLATEDEINQLKQRVTDIQNKPDYKESNNHIASLLGLIWKPYLIRTYPEGKLASNILGFYTFMDRETGKGNYGVEQVYDQELTGTPQQRLISVTPYTIGDVNPIPAGASLILTIDRAIQSSIENTLDQALIDTGAKGGTILVLDPKTGEILGMATAPRFDPNIYWDANQQYLNNGAYFNRAVGDTYEPGSVFKVLTMAAAIDAGVVTPNTIYHDNGYIDIGGIRIINWDGAGHGDQTMIGCLQLSLNVCLTWVATQLGPTRFYNYLKEFGIGQKTSVDLDAESVQPLRLPGDKDWYMGDLGTNSFGQGLAIAPIQLAAAISAVANDGKMMAPHVLRSMIVNGRQYDTPLQVVRTPIRPESAHTVSEMLATSLEQEASTALVPGYRVAGKTGTAEIAGPYGYSMAETNASFVGWGPVDDPRFLVYIWLEKPTTSIWGSVVAAPVFSEVVKNLVVLMNIPPDDKRLASKNK
jgi:cell division protein FtsI/penicillin-binding protein 2